MYEIEYYKFELLSSILGLKCMFSCSSCIFPCFLIYSVRILIADSVSPFVEISPLKEAVGNDVNLLVLGLSVC